MYYKVAHRYSLALYDASVKSGTLNKIAEDAENLVSLLKSSRALYVFFASPVISREKKNKVIDTLFKKKVSLLTINFLKLLVVRNRENIVTYILEDFITLKNEKEGKIEVQVKSAVELEKTDKTNLRKKIDKFTKKESQPVFSLDGNLIGGFTVQIKDTVIDASIRRQLDNLRLNLQSKNLNKN